MTIPYAGKKTYVIAGLMVAYGAIGAILGNMDGVTATTTILEGLALVGIRLAIK